MLLSVPPWYSLKNESLQRSVKIIEEEFTVKWLHRRWKRAEQPGAVGNWLPFVRGWKNTKNVLEAGGPQPSAKLIVNDDVLAFVVFASDLALARQLVGYDTSIKTRFRDEAGFLKLLYEIHVASAGVRMNFTTRFIPPSDISGEQTPDLLLRKSELGCEFFAECKRKDSYMPPGDLLEPAWDSLHQELENLNEGLAAGYEIVFLSFGQQLDQSDVPDLIRSLTRALNLPPREKFGIHIERKLDTAYSIRSIPVKAIQDSVLVGVPYSWADRMMHATVYAKIVAGPAGQDAVQESRFALYRVDAHKLSSVVRSFNDARQQIPVDNAGVIYIDIDVSKVVPPDVPLYIELLGEAIAGLFTPEDNTRVSGVVLSTGPSAIEMDAGPRIGFLGYGLHNQHSRFPLVCQPPGITIFTS